MPSGVPRKTITTSAIRPTQKANDNGILITDIVVWESMGRGKDVDQGHPGQRQASEIRRQSQTRPESVRLAARRDDNQVIPNPDEDPDKENDYVVPPRLVTLADAAIDDENE